MKKTRLILRLPILVAAFPIVLLLLLLFWVFKQETALAEVSTGYFHSFKP